MSTLLKLLDIRLPILQAPMAGVSTPAMAAAVSNAGGLGAIGVGATDAETARQMIRAVRTASDRPFNVNVFCHRPAVRDSTREADWLSRLSPIFSQYGAVPPSGLREIYTSFVEDDAMLAMLLEERPKVVSFHFGIPAAQRIAALREAGIVLLATATNLSEAKIIAGAGIDGVVAQGFEAGGHRGAVRSRGTRRLSRNPGPHTPAGTGPRYPGDRGGRHHGRSRHRRLSSSGRERCPTRHGVRRMSGVRSGRGISGGPV